MNSILVRSWFVDPRNGRFIEAPSRVQHGTRYASAKDIQAHYPGAARIPAGVLVEVVPAGPWGNVRQEITFCAGES